MRTHPGGPLHFDRTRLLAAGAVTAAAAGVILVLGSPSPPVTTAAPSPGPSTTQSVDATTAAPSAPATTQITAPPPTSSTTPLAPSALPTSTSAQDADTEDWMPAARGFATAFTSSTPGQDRATALQPWTTPELHRALATTDPTRTPAGTLQELRPTTETPDLVVATVLYATGLQLAITLTRTTTGPRPGWAVSTVLPIPTR